MSSVQKKGMEFPYLFFVHLFLIPESLKKISLTSQEFGLCFYVCEKNHYIVEVRYHYWFCHACLSALSLVF